MGGTPGSGDTSATHLVGVLQSSAVQFDEPSAGSAAGVDVTGVRPPQERGRGQGDQGEHHDQGVHSTWSLASLALAMSGQSWPIGMFAEALRSTWEVNGPGRLRDSL